MCRWSSRQVGRMSPRRILCKEGQTDYVECARLRQRVCYAFAIVVVPEENATTTSEEKINAEASEKDEGGESTKKPEESSSSE